MFVWKECLIETTIIEYHTHKYQIVATKVYDSLRLDFIEDGLPVVLENTQNESFNEKVTSGAKIEDQILEWGNNILTSRLNKCGKCKHEKVVLDLADYDLAKPEFKGIQRICKTCRDEIYSSISAKFSKEMQKEDAKFAKQFKGKSPIIVGGFSQRIDAYIYLRSIKKKSVELIEGDFISAKAILNANDGTFYPVFCVIDISSGGELWDSQFIAENYDINIPQNFILPFIGKNKDQIFPYKYETLSVIEEDFHQGSWFGNITQSNVKHHLTNLIEVSWPEEIKSIEDTEYVTVRTYFSIQHLLSADIFQTEINKCEEDLELAYTEDMFIKHRALCVNTIFSVTSFLEASINELFMDSSDNRLGMVRDLTDPEVATLADMWNLGIPRTANYNIIEKYQIALALLKREPLNPGIDPVQSVSVIIKLRNSLIHYEPEWVTTQNVNEAMVKQQKIEKYLMHRFEINKYTGKDNPFFPDKCLSSGLVKWAITNIVEFTDKFYTSIGLIPPYEKIRHKLQ